MFLTNKTVIYGQIEGIPYTPEIDLLSADFNVRVRDLTYSFDIAEFRRKVGDGTLDLSTSIKGKMIGKFSFIVDMAPGVTAATAPEWSKLLQACGFKETAHTTTGISWVPHKDYTHVPITCWIDETEEGASPDVLRIKVGGCMGNVVMSIGNVGEPLQMKFEFTGALLSVEDITYANRTDPTTFNSMLPPALLSATAQVNGVAQDFESLEVNINNDIQVWGDPSRTGGVKGAYKTKHEPTITMNPFMSMLATEPWWTDFSTTSASHLHNLTVSYGGTPVLQVSAPKPQLITVGTDDRNGGRAMNKTFLLTKNAGNDCLEILQGAKA